MNRRDNSQWARPAAPGEAGRGGPDVVQQGGRWARGPAFAAGLAAVALVLGVAVGYTVGRNQAPRRPTTTPSARGSTPSAAASSAPDFGLPELGQTGQQCSEQIGHRLQLGVQVTNESALSVRLRRVQVIMPLGGLKPTAHAWGTCGQLPGVPSPQATLVSAGGSAWFTVTFRVLQRCPGALPVKFLLSYDRGGSTKTVRLPGFVDLGHVPYSGCPVI